MKKSRLLFLMSAMAVMAAMVLVACGGDDSDSDTASTGGGDVSSDLITAGTLEVGSDIPFPPMEFGNPPDYEGFDIDLVNEIAKDLELEVVIEDTSFDTIFTDVAQGKFDMVASSATITADREKEVDFSDPYFEASQALLVPPGSEIASVEDLSGKTVGAQDGTTGETYASDDTDAGSVRGFPNGPSAIAALQNGQVEAAIVDLVVAQDAIDKGETGFELVANIPTGELYGLVFSQDTPALLAAVNESLASMKTDGRLNDLYQKWFEKDAPRVVIDGTNTPK